MLLSTATRCQVAAHLCTTTACELRWTPTSLPSASRAHSHSTASSVTTPPAAHCLRRLRCRHAAAPVCSCHHRSPPRRASRQPVTRPCARRACSYRCAALRGAPPPCSHFSSHLAHPGQLSPSVRPAAPHLPISPSLPLSIGAYRHASAPRFLPPPTAQRATPAAVGLTPGLLRSLCRRSHAAAVLAARFLAHALGAAAAISLLPRTAIRSPRRSPPSLSHLSQHSFHFRDAAASPPRRSRWPSRRSPSSQSHPPALPPLHASATPPSLSAFLRAPARTSRRERRTVYVAAEPRHPLSSALPQARHEDTSMTRRLLPPAGLEGSACRCLAAVRRRVCTPGTPTPLPAPACVSPHFAPSGSSLRLCPLTEAAPSPQEDGRPARASTIFVPSPVVASPHGGLTRSCKGASLPHCSDVGVPLLLPNSLPAPPVFLFLVRGVVLLKRRWIPTNIRC